MTEIKKRPKRPKMNAPEELVPYLDWLEGMVLGVRDDQDQSASAARFAGRAASTATNFASSVHVNERETAEQVAINTADIEELKNRPGLPAGGYRGAIVTKNVDGEAVWSTPIGSIVPKYFIVLDSEGSTYYVNGFSAWYGGGDDDAPAKKMLPSPLFEYKQGLNQDTTQMDWPIAWADEHFSWDGSTTLMSDPMPIQLEIYVHPRFNGQKFEISLPSAWMGSAGAPWYNVIIFNETEDFTADLFLMMDDPVYEGGVELNPRMLFGPGEHFVWHARNDWFTSTTQVQPYWWYETDTSGRRIGYPVDRRYWRDVRALEQDTALGISGVIAPMTGAHAYHNARNTSVRIGKVTASLGTAAAGSDVQIQAYHHTVAGVATPLFASPLTIPAGQKFAEKLPDNPGVDASLGLGATWWSQFVAFEVVAILGAGEYITVDVIDVGSSFAGADLTVQVYYG